MFSHGLGGYRAYGRRQWKPAIDVERTPDFPCRPLAALFYYIRQTNEKLRRGGRIFESAATLAPWGESCASPQAAFKLALSAWR